MQCIVPAPSNISRVTFKLTDVTENSVNLRLFLSCTDQSLVERYEVRYWPKTDQSLEQNMTKRPYDMVVTIDDLMMDTEYVVKVTAYDENGIAHEDSHTVRTSDRDILLQLIVFLLFGILVMAIMTTTATRRVKKMMNIKVDIPLGLLGIDEMPLNSQSEHPHHVHEELNPKVLFSELLEQDDLTALTAHHIYEEINPKVLLSELLEQDDLMPLAPYDPDDEAQSVIVKSILKKPDETVPAKQRSSVQIAIANDYVQPSQMKLSKKDQVERDLHSGENRSSGSSGYVDVSLIMKQQMIR